MEMVEKNANFAGEWIYFVENLEGALFLCELFRVLCRIKCRYNTVFYYAVKYFSSRAMFTLHVVEGCPTLSRQVPRLKSLNTTTVCLRRILLMDELVPLIIIINPSYAMLPNISNISAIFSEIYARAIFLSIFQSIPVAHRKYPRERGRTHRAQKNNA